MSLNKNISRNSFIHITGKLVSLFLGLVAVAVMTRYLGREGFGHYTTTVAFLQFFGILVDFGLTLTTVQMISRPSNDDSKVMSNIMTFRIITSFIFIGVAPILVLFFPYPTVIKVGVLITSLSFFCITLIQILTGVFQKYLKMFEVTVAEVVGRIVLVGLTVLAVILKLNIYWIFAAISLGSVFNLLIVLFYSKKYITLQPAFDWDIWKDMLKRTWPMALSISFNLIYLKMDTIILSLVRPQEQVGLYGATYRVVDILTLLPAVYMGIVLPHLAKYFHEKNFTELKKLLQQAFDALILFSVPIVLGTFLVAQKVMVFVAGADFALSGDILKVLIIASGAIFINSLFGYGIVAIDKQRSIMWAYLTVAVLTLVGYIIFIPKFGIWGAAWMTVFSEVLVTIWSVIVFSKNISFRPNFNFLLKSVLSGLIMLAVIYLIKDLHIIIILLVSGIVYFCLMFVTKALKKEFFTNFFRFKKN